MTSGINTTKLSPFEHINPVVPPIFAGRSTEVGMIHKALFEEKDSIVIYGNDAIGKSSLISTIYLNQVKKIDSGILPVRINAFDFIRAVHFNFLGITTHQICAAIWTNLIGKKYSELLESHSGSNLDDPEAERTIKRIFKIVTSEKYVLSHHSVSDDINRKSPSPAGEGSAINETKSLASFEFLYLLDELIDIIREYGYSSIMVFCDELNHFPDIVNIEILRNYFNIFHSQKIQFVIAVLSPEIKSESYGKDLIDSFNFSLGVGSYKSVADVQELIDNSISSIQQTKVFEKGVAEFLFEKTTGHPWWIQKVCDASYLQSTVKQKDTIGLSTVEMHFAKFVDELNYYQEQIKTGCPFRKHLMITFKSK